MDQDMSGGLSQISRFASSKKRGGQKTAQVLNLQSAT
jgi:hypothetical protein